MTTQRRLPSIVDPTPSGIRAKDPPEPDDPVGAGGADQAGPWEMTLHPGPPVPPEMTVASVDELIDALQGFDPAAPWEVIAPSVVPVLPRRRPMPGETDPEVRWRWPIGLVSSFGVDLGPALLFITEAIAERWGVHDDELAARAIRNIGERLPAALERGVLHESTGGLPLTAFQTGDGWASTLVLAPELLPRVFGSDPAILLAPMRDLLVALPINTDPGLAAWMLDDFASLDPNGLDVPLLVFEEGDVALFDGRRRRRHRKRGRVN